MKSLSDISLFLFDMDGTLYLGEKLFPFTKELLRAIRESGRKYLYITNNSSKGAADYVKKLARLGIAATEDEFVTSAQATAKYLRENLSEKKFYVMGTESLKSEFTKSGLTVAEEADEADAVVLGFDTELTFKKLDDVCRLLTTKPDVPYIATHPDIVCPTEYGSVPDCGSFIDMIYNAVKRRPVIIGKPEPEMIILAAERGGAPLTRTAVVGDRLYTDVKSGVNAGAVSVLVLSGETSREDAAKSDVLPDFILGDAGEIIPALSEAAK